MAQKKLNKAEAVYFPARYTDTHGLGSKCGTCRDFIKFSSECVITDPPNVSPTRGTCTQYIFGPPATYGRALQLIPASLVGYIEGPEVPTYCGRCEYYESIGRRTSLCSKVGDTEDDTVEHGGCCNVYKAREDSAGSPRFGEP